MFDLSSLDGTNGFLCRGIERGDQSGPSAFPAGDVNCDEITNAADFTILAGSFSASVTPNTDGDLNGDGIVSAADFVILAGVRVQPVSVGGGPECG